MPVENEVYEVLQKNKKYTDKKFNEISNQLITMEDVKDEIAKQAAAAIEWLPDELTLADIQTIVLTESQKEKNLLVIATDERKIYQRVAGEDSNWGLYLDLFKLFGDTVCVTPGELTTAITQHNESSTAHADLRQAIAAAGDVKEVELKAAILAACNTFAIENELT